MITIAVCDDNIQFARNLVGRLRELCARRVPETIICNVAFAFNSADEVLYYLKNHKIDILFLDIDMPNHNGFELAAELNRVYSDIIILFVSAYDNFVYSSFDYQPFRFLRKTHLTEELPTAFQKVIEKFISDDKRITFSTLEGDTSLRVKDIIFFESQRNYYHIHCTDSIYKCRGTITQAEKILQEYDFYRIHAAYLVNLEHIEKLLGNSSIKMKNGPVLGVSQRRESGFKDAYMKFTRKKLR